MEDGDIHGIVEGQREGFEAGGSIAETVLIPSGEGGFGLGSN